VFYPQDASATRGAERTPADALDRYLGELGTILRDKWACYYQGVIFHVD
jgi:hypothetical protein